MVQISCSTTAQRSFIRVGSELTLVTVKPFSHVKETNLRLFELYDMACYPAGTAIRKQELQQHLQEEEQP